MKTHFAYGSNLNVKRFKRPKRITSVEFKSLATLPGYRLVFEKLSTTDGSGKATVVKEDRAKVEGALFTCTDDDYEKLKKIEGGYSEKLVRVTTIDGEIKVPTFVADKRDPALKPYDWYVEHIVVGGRRLGLPEAI